MSTISHINECKLCKKQAELQKSHIIPKFVGRWLKNSSAAGYIRNVVNPNVRIQDLPKVYLLCRECEKNFSAIETRFANEIFYPFHTENKKSFQYGTWLKKFVISVNWRVAVSKLNNRLPDDHPSYPIFEETLETWRQFLLDQTDNPGLSENHLVFIGITDLEDFNKIQAPNYSHFLNMRVLRSVDFCTTVDNQDRIFIYTSIAGIAFISHIHPNIFPGWTNQTRIKNIGTVKTLQKNTDDSFGHFLSDRLTMINQLILEQISEKQEKIITNGVLNDPEKALKSKSLGLLNELI